METWPEWLGRNGCLNAKEQLLLVTRLPSNLRPTTRERVHLVTRGYFRSGNKNSSHTIRSAIAKNPMLLANLVALCFIEPELRRSNFYIARIGIFDFFAPVTMTR